MGNIVEAIFYLLPRKVYYALLIVLSIAFLLPLYLNPPKPLEANDILEEINRVRVENGLNPVAWSEKLAAAASKHALDMASRNYLSHTSPEGLGSGDRAIREGYKWQVIGEIIIKTVSDSPAAIVNEWMNSPRHREIILTPEYTEIGIGIAKKDIYNIVVAVFGKPI